MLVLTRKVGEEFIIADQIEVKIIGISKGRVRLGITAPQKMSVYRKELYTEIVEKNKKAVMTQRRNVGKFINIILGKEAGRVEFRT